MATKPAIKYTPRQLVLMGIALVALIAVFVWSQSGSQSPPRGFVSREAFGADWPLTVDSGILRCEPPQLVVIDTGGTTYAVNGSAKGTKRWADADTITAPHPSIVGGRMDVAPLISRGLDLCR